MHSALFVAKVANTLPATWRTFLEKAKVGLRTYKNVLRLAENVWIVDLQKNPAPFGHLVAAADAAGVPYGILPFEYEPQWLPVGFDPKTIEGRNEET